MVERHWYEITHCARENAYGDMLPAEWFVLNGPFASREEAKTNHEQFVANVKGTDADWPEAYNSAKIVHRDELAQYGLKPPGETNPWEETNPWSLTNPNGYWHD